MMIQPIVFHIDKQGKNNWSALKIINYFIDRIILFFSFKLSLATNILSRPINLVGFFVCYIS